MEKFLKIGSAYYPAKNIVSMAPNGTTATTLDVSFSGVTGAKGISSGVGNVDLLIQEINFGKQVIIDTAAIAALS